MTSPALDELRATAVLLDLDGTLTDSAPAITASIAETLATFGYPALDPDTMLRFVGPPVREGLREIAGVAESDIDAMVDEYRDRYGRRMLDVPLYPGILELVRSWHAAGVPLAVATAKPQHMAEPVLEHVGLTPYFTAICGAPPEERHDIPGIEVKAGVIARALAELAAAGADLTHAVMVGDRHHDVAGAAANGIAVVLAAWGYGRPGEEAGAAAVVGSSAELATLLGARLAS
ncbi:HAD hydrolase-like protein [Georgenia alba]|uniref:HAD hydrolase-like protein n=1 Tax=Georgenia alba TaxID=2233858 RepID=A0ABW2QEE2_9MICO